MTDVPVPVFRFAPSPNGYLHLGHAFSALLNEKLCQQVGGRLLLRIEDIDVGRCRPEFEAAILEDCAWLGLSWEEPVRRQSDHFADYACAVERLDERGLIYPCFCTRAEIAARVADIPNWPCDPDGSPLYPGTCKQMEPQEKARRLASGQYAVQRLDMEEALSETGQRLGWTEYSKEMQMREISAEPHVWGDVVLARKDVPASYHIAVVVDDDLQGVTDVVRGKDLFAATSLHRLLQDLLDFTPPRYHHHGLLADETGEKLSKSQKSKSLRQLRDEGMSADEVRAQLGFGPKA